MYDENKIDTNYSGFKEEIKDYWNKRSLTFDDEVGHGGADRTECLLWQSHFSQTLGEKSLKILDVGTGTGFIALNLAELGHQVTGIDLGEMMLEKARLKADKTGLATTFLLGDAEHPNFPDHSFDVIICRHVFWTLLEPEQTLAEWKRILTDDGLVVLIDGKRNPPKGDKPRVYTSVHEGKVYSDDLANHVPGVDVTVQQISDALVAAGFTKIRTCSLDDIAQHHAGMSREKTGDQPSENEVNMIIGHVSRE